MLSLVLSERMVDLFKQHGSEDGLRWPMFPSTDAGRAAAAAFQARVDVLKAADPAGVLKGAFDVDWSRVAAALPRHAAEDCRVHWLSVIHPTISHAKWTTAETDRLRTLAFDRQVRSGPVGAGVPVAARKERQLSRTPPPPPHIHPQPPVCVWCAGCAIPVTVQAHDWVGIARELGTGRTPIQCFRKWREGNPAGYARERPVAKSGVWRRA